VDSRLQAIDLHFHSFEHELYRQGVVTSIGFDFIILGLTGAIATVGGEGFKEALGATSAGLLGAKTSIDKNAFFEKSIPALLAQMSASRATALVQVREGLTKSVEEYPLDQALTDVENYYAAGTLPGALQAITAQAGAAKQEAEKVLFGIRTKEFFKKERQERVAGLIATINSLGDQAAMSLVKDPPVPLGGQVEQTVQLRDRAGRRHQDGAVAREMLKMMVTLGDRSEPTLEAWEAALKATP
jgi:hypothetical protein